MRRGRPSLVQGVALGVLGALGLAAVGPAPGFRLAGTYGSDRYSAVSAHDASPVKTATAECPAGQVVLGTGARVIDGGGGVRLTSVAPDSALATVTARAVALPSVSGDWAVSAYAVCGWPDGYPTLVAANTTAKCPAGFLVLGSGFAIPEGTLLTGVVPSSAAVTVSVSRLGTSAPVAYAICIADAPYLTYHPWVQTVGPSPLDTLSPKVLNAVVPSPSSVFGVGGRVLGTVWDVHIDALVPSADLCSAMVRAVRLGDSATKKAQDGGDPWSLVEYDTSAYYY